MGGHGAARGEPRTMEDELPEVCKTDPLRGITLEDAP